MSDTDIDTDAAAEAAQTTKGRKMRVPGAQAPAAAEAAQPADEGTTLNAIDVDPKAIIGPVLTRQGWVVNDEVWQKANPAEFAKLRAKG